MFSYFLQLTSSCVQLAKNALCIRFSCYIMVAERGIGMKITIQQNHAVTEPEITVVCSKLDSRLEEILSYISLIDNTVTGAKDGETFFIPLSEILYFETVDRKVFFYTADGIYETVTKIYQLEEKLENTPFARISKTSIANLKKVRSIKPAENSRLCATLVNGERVIVSRQYLSVIKQKLGVK